MNPSSRRSLAASSLIALTMSQASAVELNVVEMTIAEAQSAMSSGKLTSEDLTRAYLARIEKFNPSYNAFTAMNPKALDDARSLDRRRAAREKLGPMAGIPVVVKESVDVAGLPSTAAWAPLSSKAGGKDLIPEQDAPLVKRLRAAGAIVLAKTNIPPFSGDGTRANRSWAGATYNAYDRTLAPGASSTGSATAVSASFAMVGVAEETGTSIQSPAAAQGIVGLRPTFGLTPNIGVAPVAGSTRDVLGPHARTVTDAAHLLDVLAGYTAEDPKTVASIGNIPKGGYTSRLSADALKGKRIGLYGPGWRDQKLTPEVQKLYERAIGELKSLGATMVEDPFAGSRLKELMPSQDRKYVDRGKESVAYDFERYLNRMGKGALANSLASLKAAIGKSPFDENEPLGRWPADPTVAKSLADPTSTPDLSEFAATRQAYLDVINGVISEHRIDAFIYPQMSKPTPKLEGNDQIAPTTVVEINLAGLPGVTVPAGYFESGAPFGLIVFGRMWSEADLLGMAYAYEQKTKYRRAPELVVAK